MFGSIVAKAIAGFFVGLAVKALAIVGIYRAGEKAQAAKDTTETLKVVTAERDALATAGSAEEAARRHDF